MTTNRVSQDLKDSNITVPHHWIFGNRRKGIEGVPEIVEIILKFLVTTRRTRLLDPDDRNSLSQESFVPNLLETQHDNDDNENLINFRGMSHTAAAVGLRYLFIRISVRFDESSFQRLHDIAATPGIADTVKKLSYMVPRYFPEGAYGFNQLRQDLVNRRPLQLARNERALARHKDDVQLLDRVMEVSRSQRSIIGQNLDLKILSSAMREFPHLQQIRLMRVENGHTTKWNSFLDRERGRHAEDFRPTDWTIPFERSAEILSSAAANLPTPVSRFSSRFMSPPLPLILTDGIRERIEDFVGNLTGLDQEYMEQAQVSEERVIALSPLFALVWSAAHNLQALHVGFGDRISTPLETVFRHITMPKLKHIGLACWHLESDEIIGLLQRHKKTLRSVRLRSITLRAGRWKEVLEFIRLNLTSLKWISLNGVGYDSAPLGPPTLGGMHFVQNITGSETDSDIDLEDDYPSSNEGTLSLPEEDHEDASGQENSGFDISEGEDDHIDADETSDHEEENDDLDHQSDVADFTGVNIGDEPSSPVYQHDYSNSNCECGDGFAFSDLDDNGRMVSKEQWRTWQLWCCKPCVWHDPRPNSED